MTALSHQGVPEYQPRNLRLLHLGQRAIRARPRQDFFAVFCASGLEQQGHFLAARSTIRRQEGQTRRGGTGLREWP